MKTSGSIRFLIISVSVLGAVWRLTSSPLSSASYRRHLRFFDPDHRTCGKDELAHLFAVHYLYGAKSTEEGYYERRTISTIQELPEDKDQVSHILKVLSYIARKTHRPIRINKPIISGYNSEHKQAYSLVHASNLKAVGVDVVENGFWNRATQTQKVNKMDHPIGLGPGALGVLQALGDDVDKHEFLFDINQLLRIDVHAIGRLAGADGGYKDGAWTTEFACMEEHPKPNAIPPANDPLSL